MNHDNRREQQFRPIDGAASESRKDEPWAHGEGTPGRFRIKDRLAEGKVPESPSSDRVAWRILPTRVGRPGPNWGWGQWIVFDAREEFGAPGLGDVGSGPSSATSLLQCYASPSPSQGRRVCKMAMGGAPRPGRALPSPALRARPPGRCLSGPKRCCPEIQVQVGMSPRAQGEGLSGPEVSQNTRPRPWMSATTWGPGELPFADRGGAKCWCSPDGFPSLNPTHRGRCHRPVPSAPGDSPLERSDGFPGV